MQYTYKDKMEQKKPLDLKTIERDDTWREGVDRMHYLSQLSNRIVIVSDYDADGICSAYIMNKLFSLMRPDLEVVNIIGDRERDGYGIPDSAFNTVKKGDLVVVLDMGMADPEKLQRLKAQAGELEEYPYGGLICLDHHEYEQNKYHEAPKSDTLYERKDGKYGVFLQNVKMNAKYVERWKITPERGKPTIEFQIPYAAFPWMYNPTYEKTDYCTTGICTMLFNYFIQHIDNYQGEFRCDLIDSHRDLYPSEVVDEARRIIKDSSLLTLMNGKNLDNYKKEYIKKYINTPEYQEKLSKAFNTVQILGAIGTVADVVSVNNPYDTNRDIIMNGIEAMKKAKPDNTDASIGYLLMKLGAYDTKYLGTKDIGFNIAPVFNAAGRTEEYGGLKLLNTLLEKTPSKQDVERFIQINEKRKNIQKEYLESEEYKSFIATEREKGTNIAVLVSEVIPKGLAGIIAGRIAEDLKKPAIVLPNGGQPGEHYSGSGRNYDGFPHMYNMIHGANINYISKMGGHADALGLSCEGKINAHQIKGALSLMYMTVFPRKTIKDYMQIPEKITPEMIYELEPFGPDYPAPLVREEVVVENAKQLANNYWSFSSNGMRFFGHDLNVSDGEKALVEGSLGISHFGGEAVQISVSSIEKEREKQIEPETFREEMHEETPWLE